VAEFGRIVAATNEPGVASGGIRVTGWNEWQRNDLRLVALANCGPIPSALRPALHTLAADFRIARLGFAVAIAAKAA
jgi:hypothetical protein